MSDTQAPVTAKAVVGFTRELFKTLAKNHGGDRTLNELRVMNQIIHCHLNDGNCSVTALHNITGIPIPTVSRAVAHLQDDGWLAERRDPDDGRKRIITLGPRSLEQTTTEIDEMVDWINDKRKANL